MPVLLLLWLMSSYSTDKKNSILKKIIWVVIIMFSIIWVYNSSNLLWLWNSVNKNVVNTTINQEVTNVKNTDNIETNQNIEKISVTHDWGQVNPYEIKIKANQKYELSIMPDRNWWWCMTTITIPWVDDSVKRIIKWEEIIFNIPSLSPWIYKLVCSAMWMSQWKLIVE
jgi:hypothetical protein